MRKTSSNETHCKFSDKFFFFLESPLYPCLNHSTLAYIVFLSDPCPTAGCGHWGRLWMIASLAPLFGSKPCSHQCVVCIGCRFRGGYSPTGSSLLWNACSERTLELRDAKVKRLAKEQWSAFVSALNSGVNIKSLTERVLTPNNEGMYSAVGANAALRSVGVAQPMTGCVMPEPHLLDQSTLFVLLCSRALGRHSFV